MDADDCAIAAYTYAFIASDTIAGILHPNVAVSKKIYFPQHMFWAGFITFPTRHTSVGVDRYKSCLAAVPEFIDYAHTPFLLQ